MKKKTKLERWAKVFKMDGRYVIALEDVLSNGGRLKGTRKGKERYVVYDGVDHVLQNDGRVIIDGKPKSARKLLPKYAHLNAPHQRHEAIRNLGKKQRGLMSYIRTATNNGEHLVNELVRMIWSKRTKNQDKLKAIEILLLRGWGQAPQHVDISIEGGEVTNLTQVIQNVIIDPSSQAALEQLALAVLEGESNDFSDEAEQGSLEESKTLEGSFRRVGEGSDDAQPETDNLDATEAWEK